MLEKPLPQSRDLLIDLFRRVEDAVAAANLFHKWLGDRIREEQGNWDFCVERELSDKVVFERLTGWGVTVQGTGERFDALADRLSNSSDPLDRYLPDETPPSEEDGDCFADIAAASPLELRRKLVLAFMQFEEKVKRKQQQLTKLRERVEAQLQPESTATFLGLEIDRESGVVRREGKNYKNKSITFKLSSAEWHTLCVAVDAGEGGAAPLVWEKGYPRKWGARRKVKKRLGEKLEPIKIGFENGDFLQLKDLSRNP